MVHPLMLENGWELRTDFDGATGDLLYGFDKVYQLYQKLPTRTTAVATVPTLWGQTARDHRQQRIRRDHSHVEHGVRRCRRAGRAITT
ncbi:MAG: hypothetical protein R3E72_09390 [Steroidobacteraceae bacterium]